MAIVLYIALVMAAQAFQATPERHAPAVALGLLPGLAGWGALLLKAGLRAGGTGSPERPFGPQLLLPLQQADVWAAGAFALEQGQIIAAMLLAAMLVYVIEQRFAAAALTALVAALAAWLGLALLVALGWHFGYRLETGRWIANNQFPYTVFIAQFSVFMIGIVYYLAAWRGDMLAPHRLRDGLLAAAGFGLCSWVIVADVHPLYGVLPTFAGIASVFLANWLRGQSAAGASGGGWLVGIGKVSFSLYVLHFMLVWQPSAWVIHWFEGDVLAEWLIALPLFVIDVVLLYWAGRITLRYIETPANNLARALIRRLDKPKEIPAS